ncbi:hypothetical protein FXO38_26361 [Capsicum annuum]|nr:hypothetical protein FXO38_26361 [Capsicum annuum]
MFQKVSLAATDGQKSTSSPSVDKQIAELKTLISNMPAEVFKALKKEENKESLYEDEDKGSVIEITNDEPSVLEPMETEIQDCVHIHTECPTITEDEHMTDKEEGREEESKNTHSNDMEDISVELIPNKEEVGLEDLKKEHGPVMDELILDKEKASIEDLRKDHRPVMDEHFAAKEACCAEELNIHHSTNVKDLQWLEIGLLKYHASNDFFEKTKRIDRSTPKAYEGKLDLQTGEISHNPFDVEYVQNIPQQVSDSMDCGVIVVAYAEIWSERQQVYSCEFVASSQRARYASLLWHYGVTKTKEGYTSDNGDLPRPRNTFLQSPDERAIVTLEYHLLKTF